MLLAVVAPFSPSLRWGEREFKAIVPIDPPRRRIAREKEIAMLTALLAAIVLGPELTSESFLPRFPLRTAPRPGSPPRETPCSSPALRRMHHGPHLSEIPGRRMQTRRAERPRCLDAWSRMN